MALALVLSSADVERLTRTLAAALAQAGVEPDRLLVVARGGLVPGGLLAGLLDVACVETVQVSAYEGRVRLPAPRLRGSGLLSAAGPSGDPGRTLIVDELVESGSTLRLLARELPQAGRAVLLVKGGLLPGSPAPPGLVRPLSLSDLPQGGALFAADALPGDRWVVFPWSPAHERA